MELEAINACIMLLETTLTELQGIQEPFTTGEIRRHVEEAIDRLEFMRKARELKAAKVFAPQLAESMRHMIR